MPIRSPLAVGRTLRFWRLSLDVLYELRSLSGLNAWQVDAVAALLRVLSVRCGVVELDGQVLNELN